MEIVNCEFYTTNRKRSLKQHMFVHKNPDELETFECGLCSFTTKSSFSFGRHSRKHQKTNEESTPLVPKSV